MLNTITKEIIKCQEAMEPAPRAGDPDREKDRAVADRETRVADPIPAGAGGKGYKGERARARGRGKGKDGDQKVVRDRVAEAAGAVNKLS
jgi:hypothetical protein